MVSRITPLTLTLSCMTFAAMVGAIASFAPQLQESSRSRSDASAQLLPPRPAPSAVRSEPVPHTMDEKSEPLSSIEKEMQIVAYQNRWDPDWFKAFLEKATEMSCGVSFSVLSPVQQQSYMNILSASVAAHLSDEVQHGLGDPQWVETRQTQIDAAADTLAELQPQVDDRFSQILPTVKRWATNNEAVNREDPIAVLYLATQFDIVQGLTPSPSQFAVVSGAKCAGQPGSAPVRPEHLPQRHSPIQIAQGQ